MRKLTYTSIAALVAAPSIALAVPEVVSDSTIAQEIEDQFSQARTSDYGFIDASSDNGEIYLTGKVSSYLDRERAELIAGAIKGVESIENNIDVDPLGMTDAELRQDIEAALNAHPSTGGATDITLEVDGGVVTLSGAVEYHETRKDAQNVVADVRGVRQIHNDITLAANEEGEVADPNLLEQIEHRLDRDVWVSPNPIDVSVEDGVVTLSGEVASLWERNRAYDLSFIPGVEEVVIEALEVDHGIGPRNRAMSKMDAEQMENAIKDEWARDPVLRNHNLQVNYENGTATLSGVVDSLEEREEAGREAREMVGVEEVDNLIRVAVIGDLTHAQLMDDAHEALDRDPYLSDEKIQVIASNNRLYLTGSVEEPFMKERATEILGQIPGVLSIRNTLAVEDGAVMSDSELAAQVVDEIFWDPRVEQDDLRVTVDEGVVLLTGFVESERALHAAEQSAYSSGARDVINLLNVKASG